MFDITVIGAGPTGLVSALTFAKAGYDVAVVDPIDRAGIAASENSDDSQDRRTTAHLTPTVKFLKDSGIWNEICRNACALERLVIIEDLTRNVTSVRQERTVFDPAELGNQNFGYNVPIKDNLEGLAKLVKANRNITSVLGVGLKNVVQNRESVSGILTNGAIIETKLLIGADGGNSQVRNSLGIGVKKKYTGQTALSFHIRHEEPHFNTSTEIYSDGGPLTLVPMSRQNAEHESAVVWMQNSDKANLLANYDVDLFLDHVQEKSCDTVGKIQSCSAINARPVVVQLANQIIDRRVVLLGEAAHLLPPIGAQGYNSSIKDIKVLSDVIRESQHDPGSSTTLKRYRSLRLPDIYLRTAGVGALNFLAWSGNPLSQRVRLTGLNLLQKSKILKKTAMRFGLN
ncbi:MAG: FAD-dependent monooxygenase [Candidatus Puniceispirillaceae bacterium]